MRRRSVAVGLCLVASMANTASAQGMRDRIRELFSFGECGRPLCLDNSVNATNGHGDHFIPDLIARNGAILGFLADAIAANASNLPLSASASGETYRFVGGLPVKTSSSLGPIFGERAQTLGKNRWVVGANMSAVNFTSIRGVPLNNIILNFTHDDVPPAGLGQPLRENDVLQVQLDLNVNLLVSTFFATWGDHRQARPRRRAPDRAHRTHGTQHWAVHPVRDSDVALLRGRFGTSGAFGERDHLWIRDRLGRHRRAHEVECLFEREVRCVGHG